MRNFEERKTEILLRSEERIAKRRKHIRLGAALCISVICIISIFVPLMIYHYPDVSAESGDAYAGNTDINAEQLPPNASPGSAESAYYIQLSTGETISGDRAKQIANKLDDLLKRDPTEAPENEEMAPESVSVVYTIKIVKPDGLEYFCFLKGNSLTESGSNTVILSDSELLSLKEMLGLS